MIYRQNELVEYRRTNDKVDCFFLLDERQRMRFTTDNYEFVKKGKPLLAFGVSFDPYRIFAEDEGYFVQGNFFISAKKGDRLYTIYKSLEAFEKACFKSDFITGIDVFTEKPFIKPTLNGGKKDGFWIGGIYISIEYSNGKHKLNISFSSEWYKFKKSDSLHFLLENGSVISLSNFSKPIKQYDKNMLTSVTLTEQDIHKFASMKTIKWQLLNNEGTILQEMNFPPNDENIKVVDFHKRVFQKYCALYLSLYKQIKDEVEEEQQQTTESACFVYLMIDTTNNFYKIGISKNPKYREHTLQSDKPTIELLCAKEYPSRTIAEAIESALHKAYSSKRIRGEWFNLNDSDIEDIKKTLR